MADDVTLAQKTEGQKTAGVKESASFPGPLTVNDVGVARTAFDKLSVEQTLSIRRWFEATQEERDRACDAARPIKYFSLREDETVSKILVETATGKLERLEGQLYSGIMTYIKDNSKMNNYDRPSMYNHESDQVTALERWFGNLKDRFRRVNPTAYEQLVAPYKASGSHAKQRSLTERVSMVITQSTALSSYLESMLMRKELRI